MLRRLCGGGRALGRYLKCGVALTGGVVMLVVAGWVVQKSPALAGGIGAQAAGPQKPASPVERERLGNEVERRLKGCHERIAEIGPAL